MNIFAEGINFVNFKSGEAYNKFRNKIYNNFEVCCYRIENYSNIDMINFSVSKIVVIDLFISSPIAISNKVGEVVFHYRNRHEPGCCIVIIGKFLKDDFIENNLLKYDLYTLTSIMNINSDSDMKVVVNFVKHRNFERSKTYLLSDGFDVIEEDSEIIEKENNSNELSKNIEENVDRSEIALVVIDNSSLRQVVSVLHNSGYISIKSKDEVTKIHGDDKYFIDLYNKSAKILNDVIQFLPYIDKCIVIIDNDLYNLIVSGEITIVQRVEFFIEICTSIVEVQDSRFKFLKNIHDIKDVSYNLDILPDMIFASDVAEYIGEEKGWIKNILIFRDENTNSDTKDKEKRAQLTQVTRSASDCRLFKNKNVVTNKDGYNSISLSACYICPDCGKVYFKDRFITVTIPEDIEPYNFVLNCKNNTARCHVNINHRNGFFCDPLIAQAVCNFNNRGYKTFSCCSGHVTNKCGNLVISSTYIVFKNLTNKQKNKLVHTISNTSAFAYFFEYECNIVNDYHYGNNFALLIETSELWYYELGVCYELSHDEFIAKIYGREKPVYDEEIGNMYIKNNCAILDILSESVPTITNQELEYKRVSRKDRIREREMNKSKNNKQ